MERALIVLDDGDSESALLREAGELAAGVDAELLLLALLSTEDVESDLETLEAIANVEHTEYSEDTVRKSAARAADSLVEEVFDDLDVSHRSVVTVSDEDRAEAILETASEYDCDHVFISGCKRSPTGKVVFGDTTQDVLLNFDGRVTVELT
ncbi:universal stress protein [Natrialbaceae archaeon A-chndr2]